jgi:hypothetical protein
MVGGVKPRSFKDDTHWKEDLAQFKLPAFRAFLQDRIVKVLLAIELYAAVIAAVSVDWHDCPSNDSKDYSPWLNCIQEDLGKNCVSAQPSHAFCALVIDALTLTDYHDFSLRRSIGQPRAACRPRKVRAPESTVPGNARAGKPVDRTTEKNRPGFQGKAEKVV